MLEADELTPDTDIRQMLRFSEFSDDSTVMEEQNAAGDAQLSQVSTDQSFVQIQNVDENTYDIIFYERAARSDVVDDTTGYYTTDPEAVAIARWRVNRISQGDTQFLTITEEKEGETRTFEYSQLGDTWRLSKAGGKQVTTKTEGEEQGDRVVMETIEGADGAAVASTKQRFHQYAWGEELVEEIQDPGGAALTTVTEYCEVTDTVGQIGCFYGKVKKRVNPDGSWVRYLYNISYGNPLYGQKMQEGPPNLEREPGGPGVSGGPRARVSRDGGPLSSRVCQSHAWLLPAEKAAAGRGGDPWAARESRDLSQDRTRAFRGVFGDTGV